jgi:hypothetical protein
VIERHYDEIAATMVTEKLADQGNQTDLMQFPREGTDQHQLSPSPPRLKTIFVMGAYGSGTTAVTGALMRLGARTYAGLSRTNDPRTPTSLEDLGFKSLLHELIAEDRLSLWPGMSEETILAKLTDFQSRLVERDRGDAEGRYPYVLKHPMAALIIPQIVKVFQPKLLYVTRPLREIEASRRRRRWPEIMGGMGAARIYSAMMHAVLDFGVRAIWIHYSEVKDNPDAVVSLLSEVLDAPVHQEGMFNAKEWLTNHFALYK